MKISMKRILKTIPIAVFVIFLLNSIALGASDCWRFMNNDHDTLLIGEVIQITAENEGVEVVIRATSFIVGAYSMNPNAQLRPEIARVINVRPRHFNVGDYVVASLNQDGDRFRIAWGMFEVDSLDYRTLTINPQNRPELWEAHTDFINRGGGYGGQVIFARSESTIAHVEEHDQTLDVFTLIVAPLIAALAAAIVATLIGQALLNRASRRKDKIDVLKVFMSNYEAIKSNPVEIMPFEISREFDKAYKIIPIVFAQSKISRRLKRPNKVQTALEVWKETSLTPIKAGENLEKFLVSFADERKKEIETFLLSFVGDIEKEIEYFLRFLANENAEYRTQFPLACAKAKTIMMGRILYSISSKSESEFQKMMDGFPDEEKVYAKQAWNSLKAENGKRLTAHKLSLDALMRAMADEAGYKGVEFSL